MLVLDCIFAVILFKIFGVKVLLYMALVCMIAMLRMALRAVNHYDRCEYIYSLLILEDEEMIENE